MEILRFIYSVSACGSRRDTRHFLQKISISKLRLFNVKNTFFFQIAVAKQFAGHLAHDVEFLVANTADAGGPGLQPEDDRYSLRSGRFEVHRTGSHRRRRHDIHILPRDFNEVRIHSF